MPISEGIKLGRYEIRAHIGTNDGLLSARDIKPENIMLRRRDGIVKVLDFGLAKPVEQGGDAGGTNAPMHTQTGIVMGTASYMSPELCALEERRRGHPNLD